MTYLLFFDLSDSLLKERKVGLDSRWSLSREGRDGNDEEPG